MRGVVLAVAVLMAAMATLTVTEEVQAQIVYEAVVCPPAPAFTVMAPMPVMVEPATSEDTKTAVATTPVVWRSGPLVFPTRGAARRFYRRTALVPAGPVMMSTAIAPARVARGVYLVPAW